MASAPARSLSIRSPSTIQPNSVAQNGMVKVRIAAREAGMDSCANTANKLKQATFKIPPTTTCGHAARGMANDCPVIFVHAANTRPPPARPAARSVHGEAPVRSSFTAVQLKPHIIAVRYIRHMRRHVQFLAAQMLRGRRA